MTDNSIGINEFNRWKDGRPKLQDCPKDHERGTRICIPSITAYCCRECYREEQGQ